MRFFFVFSSQLRIYTLSGRLLLLLPLLFANKHHHHRHCVRAHTQSIFRIRDEFLWQNNFRRAMPVSEHRWLWQYNSTSLLRCYTINSRNFRMHFICTVSVCRKRPNTHARHNAIGSPSPNRCIGAGGCCCCHFHIQFVALHTQALSLYHRHQKQIVQQQNKEHPATITTTTKWTWKSEKYMASGYWMYYIIIIPGTNARAVCTADIRCNMIALMCVRVYSTCNMQYCKPTGECSPSLSLSAFSISVPKGRRWGTAQHSHGVLHLNL